MLWIKIKSSLIKSNLQHANDKRNKRTNSKKTIWNINEPLSKIDKNTKKIIIKNVNPEIQGTWCKFQIMLRKPKTARKRNRYNLFSKSPPKTANLNNYARNKQQVKLKAQINLNNYTSLVSKINVGTDINSTIVPIENKDLF